MMNCQCFKSGSTKPILDHIRSSKANIKKCGRFRVYFQLNGYATMHFHWRLGDLNGMTWCLMISVFRSRIQFLSPDLYSMGLF